MFTNRILLLGLCLLGTSYPSLAQLIKVAEMPLNDSLKTNSTVFKVKEKFALPNSKRAKMHFGPYETQIQFDMIKVRQTRFGLNGMDMTTSKIRNPVSFSYDFADSARTFNAYATCTNQRDKLTEKAPKYHWIRAYLDFVHDNNYLFSGSLLVRNDSIGADPSAEPNWTFVIRSPLDGMVSDSSKTVVGLISNDDRQVQINVAGVTGYSRPMAAWTHMNTVVTGYEFRCNNKLIGAVELIPQGISKGRVWLKNDASDELKFVVANVAEALMIDHELQGDSTR